MPHSPRFRALALFGRRLSERVDSFVTPASENLHTIGRERLQQILTIASAKSCREGKIAKSKCAI